MKFKFIVLLAMLMSLCGCSKPAPLPLVVDPHPQIRVTFGNDATRTCFEVIHATVDSSSDLPRCIVRIANLFQQRIALEYKIEWEDQYGAPLLYTAAWQRMTVSEAAEKTIVSMAKTPGGVRATVTLRLPVDVQIWIPEPEQNQQTSY